MKNDYRFRDFRDRDYEEVLSLWEATGLGDRKRGDDLNTIRRSLKMGGKFFIMEGAGDAGIIGTSWITYDGRRLHLHHFGIRPDYQGRGLSVSLLNETLRFAREKGVQIKLEVHRDNRKAVDLYVRNHFRDLGNYGIFIIRDLSEIDFPGPGGG